MKNIIPNFIKSAVLFKLKKKLKIINLKYPGLKRGQVLVKIFYSSICRSQLMEINGGRDNKKWLPHLLGHEGSGKVISIGKGVKKVKVNDDVILTWIKGQGIDSVNPTYNFGNKIINAGKVTTFSNYSIVSENRLIKKPKHINYKQACLLGCCFMTGPGMVFNETNPKKKNKIVLIGLGAVGLGALLALKEKKIDTIIVIEKNKAKRNLAKRLGVKLTISKITNKSEEKIYKLFKGKADICYESAGLIKTLEFAIKIVKNNGLVHFASHPDKDLSLRIKPYEFILGKKITGSWGGKAVPEKNIKKFSKLILKNKKIINNILNKEYKLDNINRGIYDFSEGKLFKPIIKMSH